MANRNFLAVVIAVVATLVAGPFASPTLGSLATSIGTAVGYGAKFGSFIIRAALGLAVANMAQQKVPPRGYRVTQRGTALDHQIIYGRTKAAGAIVFDATSGSSNKYLHRVLAFTGHEIEGFEEVWLNDYKLTLDSNGEVTSATNDGGTTTTTRYNGYVRVNKHLGTDGQLADGDLIGIGGWNSNCRLRGVAYLYVRLKFDAEVFPNGIPEIQAVVKGKKVYDPRKDSTSNEYDSSLGVSSHRSGDSTTWEFSSNPALCIRDYLTNSRYGLGESSTYVDDALVHAAADACDRSSTGGNFFTLNGAFTTGVQPVDVIQDLLTTMGGTLWYGQGKWRMKAAIWSNPTLTLDEDDLRSEVSIATRHSGRDNFNVIRGTWRGEDSDWQITDFPEYKVAQAITDDGGFENVQDMELAFTTTVNEAQRIARINYERNREQLTVTATFGLRAFQCQVGDFIQFNYDRMGWTSSTPKYWEVVDWNFGLSDLQLVVEMTLREISATVFDEVSNYEVYEKNNTSLASPFDTEAVTLASPVLSSSINGDGTVVPKIRWTWSVTDESAVDYYIFGWRVGASGTFTEFRIDDKLFELEPAVSGATYYYFVKSVTHNGIQSAAVTGNVTATGDTTAPSVPTNLSATGGLEQISLKWDLPSAADYKQVLIQVSDDNASWSTLAYASGTGFIHDGLANTTTKYYRIRAEDFSGNSSSYTSSVNATTSAAATGPQGQAGVPTFNKNAYYYSTTDTTPDDNGRIYFGTAADPNTQVTDGAWPSTIYIRIDEDGKLSASDSSNNVVMFDALNASIHPDGAGLLIYEDNSNWAHYTSTGTYGYSTNGYHYMSGTLQVGVGDIDVSAQWYKVGAMAPRGAGQWHITVTSLPTTSSAANSQFLSAIGVAVDLDQAWFETFDSNNVLTGQNVWLYDASTSTWNLQENVIVGDLIVDGTINADHINATGLDASVITSGEINADTLNINKTINLSDTDAGFLGGRNATSRYDQDGFYVGREARGSNTGFEVSTSSVNSSNEVTAFVHDDENHLQIYNPRLFSGGNVTTGATIYNTAATHLLGNGVSLGTISYTGIGGGGGGGYGLDNGTGSGSAGSGGDTTFRFRRGSATGTIILTTQTASGGAGGANGNLWNSAGSDGQSSSFGSGGAGGPKNQDGTSANSLSYGAGGGGGGGDSPAFLDSSGAGGSGGSSGITASGSIAVDQFNENIYLEIITLGAGGTGSNAPGSQDTAGGNGAAGCVSIASPLGGTTEFALRDIQLAIPSGTVATYFDASQLLASSTRNRLFDLFHFVGNDPNNIDIIATFPSGGGRVVISAVEKFIYVQSGDQQVISATATPTERHVDYSTTSSGDVTLIDNWGAIFGTGSGLANVTSAKIYISAGVSLKSNVSGRRFYMRGHYYNLG